MHATEFRENLLLARDLRVTGIAPSRHRDLTSVRRGVYARTDFWDSLSPWDRYRARVEAVAMTWDDPLFCLESAAIILGLPTFGEPRDIHVLSLEGESRRFGDVVVHSSRDAPATVRVGLSLVTSTLETALALCRVLPPALALGVADAALRAITHGGNPPIDFGMLGRQQTATRGRRRLDWIGARASPDAESPGESVSRAVIEWLGFEAPVLQRWFHYEGEDDRVDFYWRERRVIGESDGYGKYDASDADAAKRHFIEEKKREDRLRRHERGFARWAWSDAIRAHPLKAKLIASGLHPVRAPNTSLLATLRSNPRSR